MENFTITVTIRAVHVPGISLKCMITTFFIASVSHHTGIALTPSELLNQSNIAVLSDETADIDDKIKR